MWTAPSEIVVNVPVLVEEIETSAIRGAILPDDVDVIASLARYVQV